MDPIFQELIRQGLLGLILVLIVLGWLVPKPAVDVIVARLTKESEVKDKIIERQAAVIERLAERAK